MKAKLSKILNALINFVKMFVRSMGKINRVIIERRIDKPICDKHKTDWLELNKDELKRFRREKYTYQIFKNLSDDFEQYKDYYVTDRKYICEIMPRISAETHSVDGQPFDTLFNDKNFFERLFPNVEFPKAIVRCINGNYFDADYRPISFEKATELLNSYSKVVFKQSVGYQHGIGVKAVSGEQITETIKKFGKNFIVQELIKQHSFLGSFNNSSVNVVRVTTVFWKGCSYVLDSRLRIGAPGSFCDHLSCDGKDPIEIGISENGKLKEFALVRNKGVLTDNAFGKKIEGVVPAHKQMLEIALEGQLLYPTYGILGWDFTVNEEGRPICIEVNSKFPAIKAAQCVNGPIFMKKTVDGNYLLDEIMSTPVNLKEQKMV